MIKINSKGCFKAYILQKKTIFYELEGGVAGFSADFSAGFSTGFCARPDLFLLSAWCSRDLDSESRDAVLSPNGEIIFPSREEGLAGISFLALWEFLNSALG